MILKIQCFEKCRTYIVVEIWWFQNNCRSNKYKNEKRGRRQSKLKERGCRYCVSMTQYKWDVTPVRLSHRYVNFHPCAGYRIFGSIKFSCCIDSPCRHIISNHKIYRRTRNVYCFITWYRLYEIVLEAIIREGCVFNFVQNSQPTRYLVKDSGYKYVV